MTPRLDFALSVVYFQPYFVLQIFFPLKCGFLKANKSIIMENNVASQRGCKLVKPECKLFCSEYCWYAGNNPE